MAFKYLEMFQAFSNVELGKLLGKLEKLEHGAGSVLFEQGDPEDGMYLIESAEFFRQRKALANRLLC